MSAKKQRLSAIENILRSEIIRSQDDLQKSLINKGFEVTQATLSRDVRQLKIVKTHQREGFYRYILPDMASSELLLPTPLIEVSTIAFSGNLVVIKTHPGYAMGIASEIDKRSIEEILGTIAGDDTILVIQREGYSRLQIKDALSRILKV